MAAFYIPRHYSLKQARSAEGNISVEVKTINGIEHTLSVWRDEKAMRRFLYQGAHRRAIKAFSSLATGKTFGFEADHVPDWSEVHQLWLEKGRDYSA